MAKVSIVVPVYNVEGYLRECLDSIRRQTLKEIEVICIDDGSTDSSARILDEYADRDDRFRVVHRSNEGYGKAMNIGIGMATSPYVGIVESDDLVSDDMYEKLYLLMEEKRADVIKADHHEFYDGEEGRRIERYVPSISESRLRNYMPLTRDRVGMLMGLYDRVFDIREYEEAFLFEKYTWSGLYNREFLVREHILHNETPGASYQDNGFWFQTMVRAERIYFTRQAFYHYRIDNLGSSIHSRGKVFAVCDEYDFIYDILKGMGGDGTRFYKWASYFKITDSLDNITRVADEYKGALVERIKREFLSALERGDIHVEMYADHWRSKLFGICIDPESYIDKEKARIRKMDDVIRHFDKIIIYGAGMLGRSAQRMLIEGRRNTKVKYFAVTDMEGNPEEISGIPIKTIDALRKYGETALVIIAVGQGHMKEVEGILREKGFSHYVFLYDMID